jgi:hypothetical protein
MMGARRTRLESSLCSAAGQNHWRISGAQPGDEQTGEWTRERLLKIDARFVERMERAIARAASNGGRTARHRNGRLNPP